MPSFCREAGAGPTVLCIHPSSSSSSQWKLLMERLSSRFRVLAVDIYGHGHSPRWAGDRDLTLADEVALMAPVLADAGPLGLVGHSYGAAIAVELAVTYSDRVTSLALYEPALWGLLARERPEDAATREIEALRDDTTSLIGRGRPEEAVDRFLTYWAGEGAWDALPENRRHALVAGVEALPPGWAASFGKGPTVEQLGTLHAPCLLLSGENTRKPGASVTTLLERTIPTVTSVTLPDMGHLGPVTHAATVNEHIEAFLDSPTR